MTSQHFSPGVLWRSTFTFASFFFFGLGALLLGGLIMPLIHLIRRPRARAEQSCRQVVSASFRLFIWFMRSTGVLRWRITGSLEVPAGNLIVANHPSLIDVIFMVAYLPDALCVVKESLARNPFTRLIVHMTGYPISAAPDQLIERCAGLLNSGARIIMFPEGTRTVPGRALSFRHGAATLLNRARCPLTPVFLSVHPQTLAKGEAWFKAPAEQVRFRMDVGAPMEYRELTANDQGPESSRRLARRLTERLEKIYTDRLSNKMADRPGTYEQHGKPADGYQSPDREYSRT